MGFSAGSFKFDAALKACLEGDLQTMQVPALMGEPGIGKSQFVIGLAKEHHTRCFTLACNQLADKCDLTGARSKQDKNGKWVQVFFPHQTIANAVQYAKDHPTENPILFLDEINRTTPDVTSELLSIPTSRHIADVDLPDNLAIIVAGNDKGNITVLDDASLSRFVLYHVRPDLQTFFAVNPELNQFVRAALEKKPEGLFQKAVNVSADDDDTYDVEEILDDEDGMKQFTTPRTITGMSDWLNSVSEDTLLSLIGQSTVSASGESRTLLEEVIYAHLGNTPFATQLNLEITAGINNVGAANQKLAAPKPPIWNTLIAKRDRYELDDFVDQLSKEDLGGCLVYALYDKADRTQEVQSLVARIDEALDRGQKLQNIINAEDLRMMMQLAAQQRLNGRNIDAVRESAGGTWRNLEQIIGSN